MGLSKLWKKFRYLGYDKATIKKCENDLNLDNIRMICGVSLLLIVILIIITSFYLIFDNKLIRNLICITSAMLLIMVYISGKIILKKPKRCTSRNTRVLMNIFSLLCFLVGIYLGTFAAGGNMAVAPIWMFFFAVLIFNNTPLQNMFVFVVYGGLFVYCSYITKEPIIFYYDIMHSVTSIIASCLMSWYKTRMKVENVLALRHLEKKNLAIYETMEEQEKETALLRHKAERDEMTGLYKKQLFKQNVLEIMSVSKDSSRHALACLDIDDFKNINDSFGHMFGDDVIKETVYTVKEICGNNGFVGRFGGDEFMLFFKNYEDLSDLESKTQRLIDSCKKTYEQDGMRRKTSISIGIALYPEDGQGFNELFECADKALYHAKHKGKGVYSFYKDIK